MKKGMIANRYKLLKKLGSGAMGDVYKVRDLKDKRIIALKMLSKEKTSSEAVQRFKREFSLLAGLHHPNLCSVYDFGMLKDGRSYFTMEYIDGKDIFKASKGLPLKKTYSWVVQLSQVLEYIHSKGLIHYDIKPGNVLIAKSKEQGAESNNKPYARGSMPCVKLMDFGLTGEQRVKRGELIRGTFPYIAPEVIKGLAVDHRADLYSLGVLLYEIFTRKSLKIDKETSFAKLLEQQREGSYESPSKIAADIPARLERLILRLLVFESAERFNRANEVIREINKLSHSRFEFETEKTLEGYLLSSRFVGRDKEMGLLKSFYERACQGKGKVVLVTGDAGVGKSRLLNEFRIFTQLRRSHCFTGYARKEKTEPLQPFHGIFSELINYMDGSKQSRSKELRLSLAVLFKVFPDLTNGHLKKNLPKLVPLEPKQGKLRIFDALSELIGHCASRLGEMVILLEDLHWADDLSIQFLEYLGRNLEDRNTLICGTSRKAELEENPELKKMMINLRKENYLSQFELKPLKFRSLYSFLDSTITSDSNSSKLVRYLMKKTGGNPFFVQEIMRTLLQMRKVNIGERIETEHFKRISIPDTIEEIVLKRIRGLDSVSQKIVRFGAVLLKDFSYGLMQHLTGIDDTELSMALWELKRRQILVEEGNRYRFYHATLREAVNKRMAYSEKRKLYYRSGKTLELINKGNTERVVEDLAYYFINAKDCKKGIFYGLRAAEKSSKRYANEQAIRFYKGVLKLIGNKNSKSRFDILPKLARIESLVGYNDDAIKHYNKALNLQVGTIDKKIGIYFGMSNVYARTGAYNKELHNCRKTIKLLKKMKPGVLKSLLETLITVRIYKCHQVMGDHKRVRIFNFDSLKFPKGLRERKAITIQGTIYHNIALIESSEAEYGQGDYDKAASYFKKADKHFKRIKDYFNSASVLNNLGNNYYYRSDFQKAFYYYEEAVRVSEKIGFQHLVSIGTYNLGNILKDQGYYLEALDYLQRAFSVSKKFGFSSGIGGSLLGLGICFLKLCNYEKANEYLEKATRIFDTIGWNYAKTYATRHIGQLYQAKGDYTKALRFYRKSLKISKGIEYHRGIAFLFIDIGSLFLEIGEISKANRYIKKAMQIANTVGLKEIKIDCYIVLCQTKIMTKDYTASNVYYEQGRKLAKILGKKRDLLQFFLLASETWYYERKYSKGFKIAKKAIKLAKEMGTKDLYAEALLKKAKHEIRRDIISKIDIIKLLDEAKEIAEGIGCPEVLWKVYFEYGRFLQDGRRFRKALDYYQRCCEIFEDVGSKIKNESYKRSYLSHPDRQAVFAAANELEKLLD